MAVIEGFTWVGRGVYGEVVRRPSECELEMADWVASDI